MATNSISQPAPSTESRRLPVTRWLGRSMDEAGQVEGESNRPAMGYRLRDRHEAVVFPRTFGARGGD